MKVRLKIVLWIPFIALLLLMLVFVGCPGEDLVFGKEEENQNGSNGHVYTPVQYLTFNNTTILSSTTHRHNSRFGNSVPLSIRIWIVPANATERGIEWVSSDPSIATVSDGKVTFIANQGVVTISAISLDKGEYNDPNYVRKRADCIITIEDWQPELTMVFTGRAISSEVTTELPDFADIEGRNNRLTIMADQPEANFGIPWKDNPDGSPGETINTNGNNTFIFLDTPILHPMTVTARIRINKIGALTPNNSETNGVFLGVITDPRFDNAREVQFSGARIALNPSGPNRRLIISRDDGTMAGTAMSTAVTPLTHWDTEYIYKVDRHANGSYVGEVLNNVTGLRMTHDPNTGAPLTGNSLINGLTAVRTEVGYDLRPGRPAYAGFIISGVKAEISQFKVQIWDGPPDMNNYPTPGTVIYYSGDAEPMN
jgi:hypothetical protein